MTYYFSTADAVWKDFFDVCVGCTLVIFIFSITSIFLWFRDDSRKKYIKGVFYIASFFWILFVWIDYSTSYGRFIGIEADRYEVRLRYAGPFGGQVALSAETIGQVLYEIPGKGNGLCGIWIVERSGQSHRSATVLKNTEDCKNIRSDILSALAKS